MKQQVCRWTILGLLAGALGANAVAAPKIQFEKTVCDAGTTSLVQAVSGVFQFQNTGDAELVLQKPAPSCGCTVAGVKPESLRLAPGEKGEINFTLNLGTSRGVMEKHITVTSNDPQTPSVSLTIRANVQSVFEFAPMQILLGGVSAGFATNVTVQVRRTDGQKLLLARVDSTNPFISSRIEPVEGSTGTAAQVVLTIKPDGIPRQFYERVSVIAEGTGFPVAAIPVFGQLLGDVSVQPEAVFWGIADPANWPGGAASLKTNTVMVTKADKTLEIRNIKSSVPEVTATIEPVEAGKKYSLILKLTQVPKDSQRGTVQFETNLPGNPVVTVPLIISVLRR